MQRKYRQRAQMALQVGGQAEYTKAQLARDIGMDYNAMLAIMRNRKGVERLDLEILRLLVAHFGREFCDEFGLTPGQRKG